MTSNLAGKIILEDSKIVPNQKENSELRKQTLQDSINKTLSSIFRPEFLNRIDEIVKFETLSIDQLQKIILLQIEDLKKLLLEPVSYTHLTLPTIYSV